MYWKSYCITPCLDFGRALALMLALVLVEAAASAECKSFNMMGMALSGEPSCAQTGSCTGLVN